MVESGICFLVITRLISVESNFNDFAHIQTLLFLKEDFYNFRNKSENEFHFEQEGYTQ